MQIMFATLQYSVLALDTKAAVLVSDERGQDLVEYAVLCALVAASVVAASSTFSNAINGAFVLMSNTANNAINNA